jgi:STE24 endopeptidase
VSAFVRRLVGHWAWAIIAIALLPALLVVYGAPPPGDQPLPDGPFKQASVAILARAGVPGTAVVVRPGGGPCAWGTVAGLGSSEHIVVSPGVLTYPLDEGIFIVAHESGHVRRGDPLLGVMIGWAWLALGLGAGEAASLWAWRRWGLVGLIAFPLAFAGVWVVGTPVFNLTQRNIERRADRWGVEMTGSGASAAALNERADACLGVSDHVTLFDTLFTLTHPPPSQRIAALRAMNAAQSGQRTPQP